jgi:two-component system nitrogen regulation response regulator NtrX
MSTASHRSATILIVDDETGIRRALRTYLGDEGYATEELEDASDLEAHLAAHQPDLVLLDVVMPGLDGISALRQLRDRDQELPVVMMSGQATVERAVEATRLGAFDFLEKPLTPEKLLVTVERALEWQQLRGENRALRAERTAEFQMVGDGPAARALLATIERVAPTSAKVLILGENGTGKELVARSIHDRSERAGGPFVKVNCAAIPRDLVESELFGHERGAFTGATTTRKGKFELADGGTLFLDEVGDMSADAQAKLLRALETGEAERVGGGTPIRFDVRVIAATNKDLAQEIAAGHFREDLYYRLSVVPIQLPSLKERREDVPLLARHFLERYCADNGRPQIALTAAAERLLAAHDWPGNIRELRNLIERITIMHDGDTLTEDDIEAYVPETRTAGGSGDTGSAGGEGDDGDPSLKRRLDAHERQVIRAELERAGWNVSAAAKVLGIDRASLHRKIRRHGLSRDERG